MPVEGVAAVAVNLYTTRMARANGARLRSLATRDPTFIDPMECLAVAKLPDAPEWVWEISDITARLFAARPDSIQTKLGTIRRPVEAEMKDLRALLDSDAAVVRAEFARHIDSITMTPTGAHYVASGNWNLIGRGSIDGAGGPAWTERLPVRFEWLAAA